ncbi:MAG: DUF423 domain-containing protein [Pseudomonadota bacterium]|nr:DUF423 domain-containing protein [Pseudomonadota bacterium]
MRRLAAVLGATAVAAGAFGAHALQDRVTPERLDTWHTASSYHLLHAVALLALSLSPKPYRLPSVLFVVGILLFSGSLYTLVLLDLPVLGAVTPLGGVCFIAGWLSLARGR